MSFNIGPITLSIIQLFLVAIGVAAGLGVFNAVQKSGSKVAAAIVAIPVLGLFLIMAFFKVSELGLVAFVAKLFRNKFFDTTKKYQVNFDRVDPFDILLKSIGIDNKEAKSFEQKEQKNVGSDLLNQIET
ncbi:MAG: hypothetical protein GXP45_01950 [bacterium]|nr:hypothetical protein [bacterium]